MKKPTGKKLEDFLPPGSLPLVMEWLNGCDVQLRISRGRRSKLGDYRPPVGGHRHRISVNHDLNPYEFLITLAHEIAHMQVWEEHKGRAKPHGKAWKSKYAILLRELTGKGLFPREIEHLLQQQSVNPGYSSKGNTELARALHAYNTGIPGLLLEELPENARFSLPDGRRFEKQQKLRKWYRCLNLDNRKSYRISPVAVVIPAEN